MNKTKNISCVSIYRYLDIFISISLGNPEKRTCRSRKRNQPDGKSSGKNHKSFEKGDWNNFDKFLYSLLVCNSQ